MKAFVKYISVIAIALAVTGCSGSFAKIFGNETIDVIRDEMSVTTINKINDDEYEFVVEASEEALKKMTNGEDEGVKSMKITMVGDEAHMNEFRDYLNNGETAISF